MPLNGFENIRRKTKTLIIAHLCVTAAILGLSGLLGALGFRIVGCILVFVVMCSMMAANLVGRLPARRIILRRLRAESIDPTGGRWVSIEDSSTFNKLKIVTEDIALMLLRPEVNCIQLEGLSHRYLIYGSDVISTKSVRANSSIGTQIVYRIGSCELSLTLTDQSVSDKFKQQTIKSDPGYERVISTLNRE